MLQVLVVALAVAAAPRQGGGAAPAPAAVPVDTASAPAGRALLARAAPRFPSLASSPTWSGGAAAGAPADTPVATAAALPGERADTPAVHRRPRAIEYSDWYGRRLAMHRVMSYALLPLLAAQYYTGTQLMAKGADAPLWVIRSHAPLATASAVLFGANTVTGVWNLWEARSDPNGRTARTAHGLLMLAADAGFLLAGSIGHPAVQDGSIRSLHRTIALSSMGVALVSYAIMLPPFRR